MIFSALALALIGLVSQEASEEAPPLRPGRVLAMTIRSRGFSGVLNESILSFSCAPDSAGRAINDPGNGNFRDGR